MKLSSKFGRTIVAPIVMFLLVTVIIAVLIPFLFTGNHESLTAMVVFFVLSSVIWIWLLFGEFKKRALVIKIENNAIEMTAYLGFGKSKRYEFSEFDGFQTVLMPAEYKSYEYLFLMKENSRVITISEFYHKNYKELKKAVGGYTRNLGEKEFRLGKELRNIF